MSFGIYGMTLTNILQVHDLVKRRYGRGFAEGL
jgi:hypothetical protein